jgi:hypothetical protein
MPDSPQKILAEWQRTAAPLCIRFRSSSATFHNDFVFVKSINNAGIVLEGEKTEIELVLSAADFGMAASTDAVNDINEKFRDKFVRALVITLSPAEHCLLLEWIAAARGDSAAS